jgi:HEPN domain-containing protein
MGRPLGARAPARYDEGVGYRQGGGAVNRTDLQRLANERMADARVLLAARRWAAAYYLAGYAVECALKSCILVRVAAGVGIIFDDRRFCDKCWTHDLEQLIVVAGLDAEFKATLRADQDLEFNWEIVTRWSEASRYQRRTKGEAEELFEAITNRTHGVLAWIKNRW